MARLLFGWQKNDLLSFWLGGFDKIKREDIKITEEKEYKLSL